MKKKISLMLVCMLMLVCGYAEAALVNLVNTTFELDSAGAGTWDTTLSSEWNGNPDIASGTNWSGHTDPIIMGTGPYSGTQSGRIYGSKYANLVFGDGSNTGQYVMHWYAKNVSFGSGTYFNTKLADKNGNIIIQIALDSPDGGNAVVYRAGSGWNTVLSGTILDSVWYEFEVALDISTSGVDLRVKQAGAASWALDTSDTFVHAATSFDTINCWSSAATYGYWDDITVTEDVPGLATMVLLAFGGLVSLIRRRK